MRVNSWHSSATSRTASAAAIALFLALSISHAVHAQSPRYSPSFTDDASTDAAAVQQGDNITLRQKVTDYCCDRVVYIYFKVTNSADNSVAFQTVAGPYTIQTAQYPGQSQTFTVVWHIPANQATGSYNFGGYVSDTFSGGTLAYGNAPAFAISSSVDTSGSNGAATPELSSGELLATGLLPIGAVLLYRRRRRFRKTAG